MSIHSTRRAVLLLLLSAPFAWGRDARCERLRERIRRLESRLRSGHSAKQAIRWHRRLRELEEQRFRECR